MLIPWAGFKLLITIAALLKNYCVNTTGVFASISLSSCLNCPKESWDLPQWILGFFQIKSWFVTSCPSSSFLSSISVLTMRLLQDSSRPLFFWSLHQSWSSRFWNRRSLRLLQGFRWFTTWVALLSPPLPDADPPPLRKVALLTSLPTFFYSNPSSCKSFLVSCQVVTNPLLVG